MISFMKDMFMALFPINQKITLIKWKGLKFLQHKGVLHETEIY
jgi:hypothetical protein